MNFDPTTTEVNPIIIDALYYLGIGAAIILCAVNLFILIETLRKKRVFVGFQMKDWGWVLFAVFFLTLYTLCFYSIPATFFNGAAWNDVLEAMPDNTLNALGIWYITGLFIIASFAQAFMFVYKERKQFVSVTLLSIISGFSGTLLISVLHQATRDLGNVSNWIVYFIFAVTLSIGGVKITQMKLVRITSQIVYEKRVEYIEKIMSSKYQNFEQIEDGNIQASLNNDTETISNFASVFVTLLTSAMTTLGCFLYLSIINVYSLLLSLGVLVVAGALFALTAKNVDKYWERSRDIQNVFFKFINDLTAGFKELRLRVAKNTEFKTDMIQTTHEYVETKLLGDQKFINVRAVGEAIFYLVLGAVVFIFPLIFQQISKEELMSFLLILIYISGQITILMSTIPQLLEIRISWNRLNKSLEALTNHDQVNVDKLNQASQTQSIQLELRDVTYQYHRISGDAFSVGPINCDFHSGEIVFITGGNGSGKSTLAKLITGLYAPQEGSIHLNGEQVEHEALGEYFSTIFSDFYLFDKLYGIDYELMKDKIQYYVEQLQLTGKVTIENGRFSTTTQLSTGQKKRLGLLVSYLEDAPIVLFDEWAADQDPQFRKFFYETLLPDLKQKGKCVIAITHDDHYFNLADRMVRMELGQMVQSDASATSH